MASVNLSGTSIVVQADNTSNPVTIVNWADHIISYQEPDIVRFTVGKQGWTFGPWDITPCGQLLEIAGVDVSAYTAAQKAAALVADITDVFDANKASQILINGNNLAVVGPGVPLDIQVVNSAAAQVGTINGIDVEIGDSSVEVNGTPFTTVAAEATVDIPVVEEGTLDPVGSKVGGNWEVPPLA